jgi:hypothetical protein
MITINFKSRENPDYEAQLSYLIRREFYVSYNRFARPTFYLIGITVILFSLIQFASGTLGSVIVVFIALISLVWIIAIWFGFTVLFKWIKRYKWKKDCIKAAENANTNFTFSFDKEKICFESSIYKTEISWDYYSYWTEHKKSIFLFEESNIYDALYYSERDLGYSNYAELKLIVAEKLQKLEDADGS